MKRFLLFAIMVTIIVLFLQGTWYTTVTHEASPREAQLRAMLLDI